MKWLAANYGPCGPNFAGFPGVSKQMINGKSEAVAGLKRGAEYKNINNVACFLCNKLVPLPVDGDRLRYSNAKAHFARHHGARASSDKGEGKDKEVLRAKKKELRAELRKYELVPLSSYKARQKRKSVVPVVANGAGDGVGSDDDVFEIDKPDAVANASGSAEGDNDALEKSASVLSTNSSDHGSDDSDEDSSVDGGEDAFSEAWSMDEDACMCEEGKYDEDERHGLECKGLRRRKRKKV
jgi:hypothetical protein